MRDDAADETDPADEQRPWTEAQWEAFMKRSDLRAARFGELMETLMNDPDRDAKIDREMGWHMSTDDADDADDDAESDFDVDAMFDPDEEALKEAEQELRESDAALEKIQAYRYALRAERQVHRVLEPYINRKVRREPDERFSQVWISPCIAAAKIAGGHTMGYDDEVLCGNIVNIRRGLSAVEEGLRSVRTLKDDGLIQAEEAKQISGVLRNLQRKINGRIAELRERVWWDDRK